MCGPTCTNCRSHLLIVNPPRVVNGQDEVRHAANVEGVEHGPNGHADDGQPHLSNILRRPSSKANAQHVGNGLEECPRVLLKHWHILHEWVGVYRGHLDHVSRESECVRVCVHVCVCVCVHLQSVNSNP